MESSNDSTADLANRYRDGVNAFTTCVARMHTTSRQTMSKEAGERLYWGSVLFTRMTSISTSILTLCPESVLTDTVCWDFGSIASLVRNLHECALFMFYLAIEAIPPDEWRARLNVMQLHDFTERRKMFRDFGHTKEEEAQYDFVAADLHSKLRDNTFFAGLESPLQKDLLKGSRAMYLTNKQISRCMGDTEQNIWGWYRFFSCHTHSTPLSFYRVDEQKRDGTETDIEKDYVYTALQFATQVLDRAIVDYLREHGVIQSK